LNYLPGDLKAGPEMLIAANALAISLYIGETTHRILLSFSSPSIANSEYHFPNIKFGKNNVSPGKRITTAIQTIVAIKNDNDSLT
jgi:hypothetical protein